MCNQQISTVTFPMDVQRCLGLIAGLCFVCLSLAGSEDSEYLGGDSVSLVAIANMVLANKGEAGLRKP